MITLNNVSICSGEFKLQNISFEVPSGKYGVLMGRSGCGKTTILETICGLRSHHAGSIKLVDREMTGIKSSGRGVGYVPQDAALFLNMTVREHIAFALVIRKRPTPEIDKRVMELADLLGITHLLERMPLGLSGGESQRVALGRALSHAPSILCLDEPLSSVDEETREEMCVLLKSVQMHTKVTALHVTHSGSEAERLADYIFRLEDGGITT